MARVEIYEATVLSNLSLWRGTVDVSDDRNIVLVEGGHEIAYYGRFDYESDGTPEGRIYTITLREGDDVAFRVSDLLLDMTPYYASLNTATPWSLMQSVRAGADVTSGPRGGVGDFGGTG